MPKRLVVPAEALSKDTQAFFEVINEESDFSVIVVSCAYLDACLASILEKHLLQSSTSEKLLDARSGALGSFSARADACYALGLISKDIYQDLLIFAEVRNQVAHNHLLQTFTTLSVAKSCSKLMYLTTLKRWDRDDGSLMFSPAELAETRPRFTFTAVMLSQRLLLIALGVNRVARAA